MNNTNKNLVPLEHVETAQDLIWHPHARKRFKALSGGFGAGSFDERNMILLVEQSFRQTPKLAQCTPMSLFGALAACAKLRLEPNTVLGKAYLIPYEKRRKQGNQWVTDYVEAQLQIGYKGLIDLAMRTGKLDHIHADVVRMGDLFEFSYGTHQELMHRPTLHDRGEPIAVYCYYRMINGGQGFVVLGWDEVMAIRDNSQGFKMAERTNRRDSPWHTHELAMARKTAVRALFNRAEIPVTTDYITVDAIDDRVANMAAAGIATARAQSDEELSRISYQPVAEEVSDEEHDGPEPEPEPKPEPKRARAAQPKPEPKPEPEPEPEEGPPADWDEPPPVDDPAGDAMPDLPAFKNEDGYIHDSFEVWLFQSMRPYVMGLTPRQRGEYQGIILDMLRDIQREEKKAWAIDKSMLEDWTPKVASWF